MTGLIQRRFPAQVQPVQPFRLVTLARSSGTIEARRGMALVEGAAQPPS